MRERYASDSGIKWKCADVRELPLPDRSVDVAFDKGTIDAMIYGSPWSPPETVKENTRRYIDEVIQFHLFNACAKLRRILLIRGLKVGRVLKDDGIFLYVTFRQPHFMKPLLNRDDRWDLTVETLSDNDGSFEYYGFILKKKR